MRTESKDLSAANFKYSLFTKDEKPVNLLNLQNPLTYTDSYKGKMIIIRITISHFYFFPEPRAQSKSAMLNI